MSCSPAQPAAAVARPTAGDLVDSLVASLRDAWCAVLRAASRIRRERRKPVDEIRAFDAIAHLDAHVLKDIGAPHWLVAQAAMQRDRQHLRWPEIGFR